MEKTSSPRFFFCSTLSIYVPFAEQRGPLLVRKSVVEELPGEFPAGDLLRGEFTEVVSGGVVGGGDDGNIVAVGLAALPLAFFTVAPLSIVVAPSGAAAVGATA